MDEQFKIEKVPSKLEAVKKVFDLAPELAEIGDEREYLEYVDTIFPDSVFNEIVWHNSNAEFKDEGFKPTKPTSQL